MTLSLQQAARDVHHALEHRQRHRARRRERIARRTGTAPRTCRRCRCRRPAADRAATCAIGWCAAGDQPAHRFIAIELAARAGRGPASPPDRVDASCFGGHELRDRHLERHRDPVGGIDPHAHGLRSAPPALAVTIEMPRAVHAHVRAQDQVAAEHDQVMLAGRLAPLDGPADDRRVDVDAIEVRVGGLEPRDDVAGEHAVHRSAPRERSNRPQASSLFGSSLELSGAAARAAADPSRWRRSRLRAGT